MATFQRLVIEYTQVNSYSLQGEIMVASIKYFSMIFIIVLIISFPAAAQTCGEHVVARGETLFSIAQQYGTTVDAMAAANNIANPSQIFAGQTLIVPCADVPVVQGRLGALLPISPATAEQVQLLYGRE